MKIEIAAYITCYYDILSTKKCVQAIESQSAKVSLIYITNNSKQALSLESDNTQLIIHHHPENIGISGGLQNAIQWAVENNYDFLWTFDQDSFPTPNCLEILLTTYESLNREDYKVGIIAPTPIDPTSTQIVQGVIFQRDMFIGYKPDNSTFPYECDAPITSGSFISLAAAKMIEPPRSDLFIDGVDLDYGYRLKQQGFHNIIVPDAIMYHNFGDPKTVKFLNRDIIYQQYIPLRHYYICRNHTYLELQFSQGIYKITCLMKRFKYLIYTIIKISLYEKKEKSPRVFASLLGTYHGLIGKLGKAKGL